MVDARALFYSLKNGRKKKKKREQSLKYLIKGTRGRINIAYFFFLFLLNARRNKKEYKKFLSNFHILKCDANSGAGAQSSRKSYEFSYLIVSALCGKKKIINLQCDSSDRFIVIPISTFDFGETKKILLPSLHVTRKIFQLPRKYYRSCTFRIYGAVARVGPPFAKIIIFTLVLPSPKYCETSAICRPMNAVDRARHAGCMGNIRKDVFSQKRRVSRR